MNLLLLKASTITIFGRGSEYPARAAIIRLGVTLLACFGFAFVMTPTIRSLPLIAQLPDIIYFLFVAVCFQALTAACLIIVAGSLIDNDGLSKLLTSLPIKNDELWGALVLPKIILATLLLALTAQPLFVLANKVHFSLFWLVLAILAGILSGIAVSEYRPTRNLLACTILSIGLLTAQTLLCRQLFDDLIQTQQPNNIFVGLITLLLIFPLLWLMTTVRGFRLHITTSQRTNNTSLPLQIPLKLWPYGKILRNKRMLGSLAFTFSIVFGLAAYALHKKTGMEDGGVMLLTAAILTSAYCTDLRGLSRRSNPPEIIALRGTSWFFLNQLRVILTTALLLTLPVGIASQLLTKHHHLLLAAQWLGLGLFGAAVGLLISTVLVPSHRDLSRQFLGAMLSTAMFFGLPKLSLLANLSPQERVVGYLALAVGLIVVAYLIELNRNNFEWRQYATRR